MKLTPREGRKKRSRARLQAGEGMEGLAPHGGGWPTVGEGEVGRQVLGVWATLLDQSGQRIPLTLVVI